MDFGWACGRYIDDSMCLLLPCWWSNATINCEGWNWRKAYVIGCIVGWPLGWDDQWLLGTSGRCEDGKTKGWLNDLINGESETRWTLRWLTARDSTDSMIDWLDGRLLIVDGAWYKLLKLMCMPRQLILGLGCDRRLALWLIHWLQMAMGPT